MRSLIYQNEKGIASIIALLLVGMMTMIGLAALSTSEDEVAITGNELQEMRAFYAAEAGLEKASAIVESAFQTTNLPPATLPSGIDSMNMAIVAYNTTDDGPAMAMTFTDGTLSGLQGMGKSYTINSIAVSTVDHDKIEMSHQFQSAEIPIYQFAIFYQDDLEIGQPSALEPYGRVHANGDFWVNSAADIDFDNYYTAFGSVLHGLKGPGIPGIGDVRIQDELSLFQTMQMGGSWLDATQPDWIDSSVARWGGRVKDAAHGQDELKVPLDNVGVHHKMIEQEAANADSWESKATLKIINNIAYQLVGGVWSDVTADMVAKGIITYTANQFRDQRENKWMDCTQLDINLLYFEGYGPANGIFYFSDNTAGGGNWPALRLVNGGTLNGPLTIVSENPLYTIGDYNIVAKQPASFMADAITFLSSNWNDANSNFAYTTRPGVATTINASYVAGHVATTGAIYSGGFENLPRLLEDWLGADLNWTGSGVCLWESVQSNSNWGTGYFSAPTLNWQFDTDLTNLANMPPGTPVVRVYRDTGWKQEFVGYENAFEGVSGP